MPKVEIEFSDVMRLFTEQLRKDKSYYYSWQANIACAFQDEYMRANEGSMTRDIHDISNNAAKYFLDMLCRDNKNNRVFLKKPYVVLKDEDI